MSKGKSMKNVQLNELYKCLDAERLLKTKLVTLALLLLLLLLIRP